MSPARSEGTTRTSAINEDAEFAIRIARKGGIWFDPSIYATYSPRSTVREVARQFYRYGLGRAGDDASPPIIGQGAVQLLAPALVLGLLSPWRRQVAIAYLGVLVAGAIQARREGLGTVSRVPAVLIAMHVPWGVGVLVGTASAALSPFRPTSDGALRSEVTR